MSRANGEGSIGKPRPDGAIEVRATDPITGRRVKRVVHRRTRDDGRPETPAQHRQRAAARLAELLAEVAQPAAIREGFTVERWAVERYLPSIRERLAEQTYDGYSNILSLYVVPHVGTVELAALTVDHVDGMDRVLVAAGLSMATRRQARGALSRVVKHARSKGQRCPVQVADADVIATRDRVDRTKRILDTGEVRALLDAARGTRWEAPLALAALTGMRRSEVLGLGWDAVDLDRGLLTVSRGLVELSQRRSLSLGPPKSNRLRTVALSAPLVALLRARRVQQAADRLAAGPVWATDMIDTTGEPVALVFTDEAGRPIIPGRFSSAVKRIGKSIGRDVHPHLLRHGAASLLLDMGVAIPLVASQLGHSSPQITMTTYAHAVERSRETAGTAISDAVGQW